MRLEDLGAASIEDLRRRASTALQNADDPNISLGRADFYRAEARFYLEEIERRENNRISNRDFRLELIVILLILAEIIITVGLAIWGGRQQSAETTRELQSLGTVQTSLQKVDSDLSLVASQLKQLNTATQQMGAAVSNSASTSLKINSALQTQLKIVSAEQKERSQELARKPVISALIGNVPLSVLGAPIQATELTNAQAKYEIVIQNGGTEPLINGLLRIGTNNSKVTLSVPSSSQLPQTEGEQGNGVEIPLPRLGQGVHTVVEATFNYSPGTPQFSVVLTIDGDNLPLTIIGNLLITPPQ